MLSFTARAQDAGEPEVIDVERAIITQRDGGVLDVYAGCWLSDGVCMGTAKELTQLRVENEALKKTPPGALVAVGAVCLLLGLVLGGVAVYQVTK